MSDEENFMEGGTAAEEQELPVGQKVGFLPGMLLKVLKWSAMAIAAIIFIVTVVVITINVTNKGTKAQSYPVVSPQYKGTYPIYDYYSNIEEIRGRTADINPVTLIITVIIGYETGNKVVQGELIARTPYLTDLIRGFFSKKTAAELRPQFEDEIKLELKELINRVMSTGQIEEVIFKDFNVIEF